MATKYFTRQLRTKTVNKITNNLRKLDCDVQEEPNAITARDGDKCVLRANRVEGEDWFVVFVESKNVEWETPADAIESATI